MRSGNRPYLDPEAVHRALVAIKTAHPLPPEHPLLSFLLVQAAQRRPEALAGDYATLFAVTEVINTCFEAVLGEREGFDPQAMLIADYQTEQLQRQTYSLLYYRYLEPHWDISHDQVAKWVGFAARSLQRHQTDGLALLTQDLIDRETSYRRQYLRQVLAQRLPYPLKQPLYGREELLNHADSALRAGFALLVTGATGIGKTHFLSALAGHYLNDLDDILWLTLAPQLPLLSQLALGLGITPYDETALALYFANTRVWLVLENLQPDHLQAFNAVRGIFHRAYVLATAATPLQDWSGAAVQLPPLEYPAAAQLIQGIAGTTQPMSSVWELAGGVPALLLAHAFSGDPLTPVAHLGGWLLAGGTLPFSQVQAWTGLTTAEVGRYPGLFQLQGDQLQGISVLSEAPTAAALQTVAERWLALPPTRADLLLLLRCLDGLLPSLSVALRDTLLDKAAFLVGQFSVWGTWHATLASLTVCDPLWLEIEQARLERLMGLLVLAQRRLEALIQATGQAGLFALQARALLEGAHIALYTQDNATAYQFAERAALVFQRHHLPHWQGVCRVVQAQAHPDQAFHLLANQPLTATHAQLLSQAALAENRLSEALGYGRQAVDLAEPASATQGRALAALAYLLYLQQQPAALDCQQQAVNLLQLTPDVVACARAQNNLGVLYYEMGHLAEAQAVWEDTQRLLLPLQDGVALRTVRANLALSAPVQRL